MKTTDENVTAFFQVKRLQNTYQAPSINFWEVLTDRLIHKFK